MRSKLRRRLTILYTSVFGGFLLAFILIICCGLVWSTYVERTNEINFVTKQIIREQRAALVQYNLNVNSIPQETTLEDDNDISGQIFYYIENPSGQIIKSDLPVPALREETRLQIINWIPTATKKFVIASLPNGNKATLIIVKRGIHSGGQLQGTIFVGKDITAYTHMLIRSILITFGVAVFFLLIAARIGYSLAGKVIIPIEHSMKRQKQFVADASHELRNPLSVLLTSIEAIQMDKGNILSSFSTQTIQEAKDEFFRLIRLVNDLLTLARTDAGEFELKKEIFSLNAVATQVIRSLHLVAEQKGVHIQLNSDLIINLQADPEKIHQILYILIDNAIKYTAPNTPVLVHLRQDFSQKKTVEIVVEDQGPGISLEFQQHIFEPFVRVDEARAKDIEGSGLGLSIAKWIAEAHHGQITVNSQPGNGSKFIVTIPNNGRS